MALDATTQRRWLGAAALLAALAMIVAGQTVIAGRLSAVGFLIYWLVCLGFTGVAIVVALIDLCANQRRLFDEQQKLVQTTLKDIETEARKKPAPSKSNGRQDD